MATSKQFITISEEFKKGAISMDQVKAALAHRNILLDRHTIEEAAVLKLLKEAKIQTRFQEILYIGHKYIIVDFLLPTKKVILELDGNQHFTPEKLKTDLIRDAELKKQGYKVIRISNYLANQLCVNTLKALLKNKPPAKIFMASDIMTFGKYKGDTVKEVLAQNKQYLIWLHRSFICTFGKDILQILFLV